MGRQLGCDIPYEFYKNGDRGVTDKLYILFKEIWVSERVPDKCNECKVILLHKGGYKSKKRKNYRPIALTDTVGKIFCSIVNERCG